MRIVIKLGGELLAEERRAEASAIAVDVATLVARGEHVIFVHGGGPQTTALQKRLGQEPQVVGGRRITDAAALEAIQMMVAGKLNVALCSLLLGEGLRPIGLNGASSQVIAATKRPPRIVSGCGDEPVDFGHVGDVAGVNQTLLSQLLENGYTPVLACLGADAAGRTYNINADIVATQLAKSVRADRLLLVTSAPGVLKDIDEPSSRIERMTVTEAQKAIADGVVVGGMIPKLEESFNALAGGVAQVQILGRLVAQDVLHAVDRPGAVGTVLVPDA